MLSKTSLAALGFLLSFLPVPAMAQTLEQKLAVCAIEEGSLDRLACFDAVTKALDLDGPQPVAVPVADNGKWVVSRDRNPIDDTETVTLTLVADEGQSRFAESIFFVARCKSNQTEAYIVWNDYIGSDFDGRGQPVTIRVGSEPADNQRWSVSTDGQATFAPEWAGTLLKRMVQSEQFVAQTTPYNESPRTAVFDTSGLRNALVPLMEVCDWSIE